jgi:hypothetical protein
MNRRVLITYDHKDFDKGDEFCRFLEGKDPAWKVVDRHHSHAGHVRNVGLRWETSDGEIERTTATVVLIGAHTKDNGSVINEISDSLSKKRPNGILGIKLHRSAEVPALLKDCGAEVLEWDDRKIVPALERAVRQSGRVVSVARYSGRSRDGCSRGPAVRLASREGSTSNGTSATQSGVGASATQSGAGASATQSGAGASATQSGAGASATQSGAGASATQSGVGASATQSGAGASATQSGAGASATQSGAGASATQSGAGASATQSGAEASEAVVEAVRELAEEGWLDGAARDLADALGNDIWVSFGDHPNCLTCDLLAAVAQALLSAEDFVGKTAGSIVADALSRAGRSRLECEVARRITERMVSKVPLPLPGALKLVARRLQALGILICLFCGRLERCQCLIDIENEIKDSVLKKAEEKLEVALLKEIIRRILKLEEVEK